MLILNIDIPIPLPSLFSNKAHQPETNGAAKKISETLSQVTKFARGFAAWFARKLKNVNRRVKPLRRGRPKELWLRNGCSIELVKNCGYSVGLLCNCEPTRIGGSAFASGGSFNDKNP
jgi:hypothetical protein